MSLSPQPRRPRVHRPVICGVCKAEMDPHVHMGWFICRVCGAKRP